MKDLNSIEILGVPFTDLFESEILNLLQQSLQAVKPIFLATPNPEMLLACQKDPKFKKVLQSTAINIPDGNGIIWAKKYLDNVNKIHSKTLIVAKGVISIFAFLFHSKNTKKRFNQAIHGSDLMQKICSQPQFQDSKIFLLGNKHALKSNTAELTSKKLQQINPAITIVGHYDSEPGDQSIIEKINHSQAQIVFVAFGAPHQESWIAQNLTQLKTVKVIIGVGGSFDFIAGIIPRAPHWLRKIGLEWVYRLAKQPLKRFKRIWNAFIVFPYQIIKTRLQQL